MMSACHLIRCLAHRMRGIIRGNHLVKLCPGRVLVDVRGELLAGFELALVAQDLAPGALLVGLVLTAGGDDDIGNVKLAVNAGSRALGPGDGSQRRFREVGPDEPLGALERVRDGSLTGRDEDRAVGRADDALDGRTKNELVGSLPADRSRSTRTISANGDQERTSIAAPAPE